MLLHALCKTLDVFPFQIKLYFQNQCEVRNTTYLFIYVYKRTVYDLSFYFYLISFNTTCVLHPLEKNDVVRLI